jgi:hypothetical protein
MSTPPSVLDGLVQEASKILKGGHTFGDLIGIAGLLAGRVNTLKNLTGVEKKKLVLDVLVQAVQATVPSEKSIESLQFIEHTVPSVLDVAVNVGRGVIDLRKPEVIQAGCFALRNLLLSCVQAKAENPVRHVLTSLAPPATPAHHEVEIVEQKDEEKISLEENLQDVVGVIEKVPEEEEQTKSEASPNTD